MPFSDGPGSRADGEAVIVAQSYHSLLSTVYCLLPTAYCLLLCLYCRRSRPQADCEAVTLLGLQSHFGDNRGQIT